MHPHARRVVEAYDRRGDLVHPHTLAWHAGPARAVLTVAGDVGGSPEAAEAFAAALTGLADLCATHDPATPVVDMTAVGFLESSALNALIRFYRVTGTPVHIALTAGQTFIRRVIALSGLEDILVVEDVPPA
jgi:anti-anti-sigma factor